MISTLGTNKCRGTSSKARRTRLLLMAPWLTNSSTSRVRNSSASSGRSDSVDILNSFKVIWQDLSIPPLFGRRDRGDGEILGTGGFSNIKEHSTLTVLSRWRGGDHSKTLEYIKSNIRLSSSWDVSPAQLSRFGDIVFSRALLLQGLLIVVSPLALSWPKGPAFVVRQAHRERT